MTRDRTWEPKLLLWALLLLAAASRHPAAAAGPPGVTGQGTRVNQQQRSPSSAPDEAVMAAGIPDTQPGATGAGAPAVTPTAVTRAAVTPTGVLAPSASPLQAAASAVAATRASSAVPSSGAASTAAAATPSAGPTVLEVSAVPPAAAAVAASAASQPAATAAQPAAALLAEAAAQPAATVLPPVAAAAAAQPAAAAAAAAQPAAPAAAVAQPAASQPAAAAWPEPGSITRPDPASRAAPFPDSLTNLTLVFPVLPMSAAPSPPRAYLGSPMHRWAFTPGSSMGYIVITRQGPSGPAGQAHSQVYSQLIFLPGKYAPRGCGGKRKLYSVQRFWTDNLSQASGFPAELAEFVWGPRSVDVAAAGQLLFSASFTGRLLAAAVAAARSGSRSKPSSSSRPSNRPSSSSSSSSSNSVLSWQQHPGRNWLAPLAAAGIITMQWPLSEQATTAAADRSPTRRTATAAAGGSASSGLMPTTQALQWGPSSAAITLEAASVVYDPAAFTGSEGNVPLVNRGWGSGFIPDTPATFTPPAQLVC